jgi:hypothetical protein
MLFLDKHQDKVEADEGQSLKLEMIKRNPEGRLIWLRYNEGGLRGKDDDRSVSKLKDGGEAFAYGLLSTQLP